MTFTIAEDIKTLLNNNFSVSNFVNAVQTEEGLLIYLPLDSNLTDYSGNSNSVALGSGSSYETTTVKHGTASLASNNTSNAYARITGLTIPDTNDAFSISMWIYWSGTPPADDNYYIRGGHDAGTAFSIIGDTIGNMKAVLGATSWGLVDWSVTNPNVWSHVVVIWHWIGTTAYVDAYIDKVEIRKDDSFGVKTFPAGTSHDIHYDSDGFVDDVRFYDRKLTTTEISNLYDLKNADGTQHTLLSNPTISLLDDDTSNSFDINGEIIIGEEQLLRIGSFNGSRSETFLVDLIVRYDTLTGSTPDIIKQILKEIDRVMDAESIAHTTYFYKPRYSWNGSYRVGVVKFQVEVLNALVVRPGLT